VPLAPAQLGALGNRRSAVRHLHGMIALMPRRRPRHPLLWAVGLGIALLLAPTVAGAAILAVADARATSFHWRLEANYGPTGEGWVTPDALPAEVYPGQPVGAEAPPLRPAGPYGEPWSASPATPVRPTSGSAAG
jgi:hypothetical protein